MRHLLTPLFNFLNIILVHILYTHSGSLGLPHTDFQAQLHTLVLRAQCHSFPGSRTHDEGWGGFLSTSAGMASLPTSMFSFALELHAVGELPTPAGDSLPQLLSWTALARADTG